MDKNTQYIEAQKAWMALVDLKEGDSVKVLSTAKGHEHGWHNSWNSNMDKEVGKVLTVVREWGGAGINLLNDKGSSSFSYPFFVLQKVDKPLPEPIMLDPYHSDGFKAEFKNGGDIKVGCQNISFDVLKKIYETAAKVKGN
jgi:hypothetical protein